MCIEKLGEKKIAESDIVCWKFGTLSKGIFESLVYRFKYVIGDTHITDIVIMSDNVGTCGFHSYKNEKDVNKIISLDVVKCIIPKGSTYYIGSTTNISNQVVENYISNALIVIGRNE
jgi:hypothetical protein